MPKLQSNFSQLLAREFGEAKYQKSAYSDYRHSPFHEDIMNIYRNLNGQLDEYPVQFKGFDIQLPHCIVELDEEQHFNRYRTITLNSTIYNTLKSFSLKDYRTFCLKFENKCLKKASNGKYWDTSSTGQQFGFSSPNGDLTGYGSSRWKQRAFYDFLRDVGQKVFGYNLIRISIYQEIEGIPISNILSKNLSQYYPKLLEII